HRCQTYGAADRARDRGAALARSRRPVRTRRRRRAALMSGSLAAVLREAMSRHAAAGRIAIDGPLGTVPYGELVAAIDRFAGAMRDWGVVRGERVALLLPRAETVTAFFGVIQSGGCACVLEPRLKPEEIAGRLAAVGARRLVVGASDAALAGALPGVDVREMARLGGTAVAGPALDASDDAMMQFTSGSTGLP